MTSSPPPIVAPAPPIPTCFHVGEIGVKAKEPANGSTVSRSSGRIVLSILSAVRDKDRPLHGIAILDPIGLTSTASVIVALSDPSSEEHFEAYHSLLGSYKNLLPNQAYEFFAITDSDTVPGCTSKAIYDFGDFQTNDR